MILSFNPTTCISHYHFGFAMEGEIDFILPRCDKHRQAWYFKKSTQILLSTRADMRACLRIQTKNFNKRDPGKRRTEDALPLLFVYKTNGDAAKKTMGEQTGALDLHHLQTCMVRATPHPLFVTVANPRQCTILWKRTAHTLALMVASLSFIRLGTGQSTGWHALSRDWHTQRHHHHRILYDFSGYFITLFFPDFSKNAKKKSKNQTEIGRISCPIVQWTIWWQIWVTQQVINLSKSTLVTIRVLQCLKDDTDL